VVVPADAVDLYTKLVAAFVDNPRVFVLRDRRVDARALRAPEVFAVGGGELEPALRTTVEDALRRVGARG
jgi:hypothetical protein